MSPLPKCSQTIAYLVSAAYGSRRTLRDALALRPYADTPTPIRRHAHTPTRSQAGVSLVEMSIALVLFTTVAVFGFQTIMAGWILQNSAIMQSMTDAYAGIETAYAQRWTFAGPNGISGSGRWPVYPASSTTVVTIGKTPKGPVNATVVRTMHQNIDPLTGAPSYMLESYVVYKDELRQYCKVSKVYRTEWTQWTE
jgi:hypothetical protein